MKALCVADFHGEEVCLDYLRGFLESVKPDVVVVAGDFTDNGPVGFAEDVLEALGETPAFFVHGNMDSLEVKKFLEKREGFIHNKKTSFEGVSVAGLGGTNTTPFGTPLEYTEEEIKKVLDSLEGVDLLVSHPPPFDTEADKLPNGLHVGSKALREWIQAKKPRLVVCAHIHETEGIEALGETTVVKLAPLMQNKAALVDLESWEAKLLDAAELE